MEELEYRWFDKLTNRIVWKNKDMPGKSIGERSAHKVLRNTFAFNLCSTVLIPSYGKSSARGCSRIRIAKAEKWLQEQRRTDGSFATRSGSERARPEGDHAALKKLQGNRYKANQPGKDRTTGESF